VKGALAAQWGTTRRGGLDLWLDQTAVLPADLRVAQTWGAIAACCVKSGLPLVTLNRRDFADLAEHEGLVLL
jgi:toxin FitB